MKCILYERECCQCDECNFCDLEPQKICDNCCKCIEGDGSHYKEILIDEIILDENKKA